MNVLLYTHVRVLTLGYDIHLYHNIDEFDIDISLLICVTGPDY